MPEAGAESTVYKCRLHPLEFLAVLGSLNDRIAMLLQGYILLPSSPRGEYGIAAVCVRVNSLQKQVFSAERSPFLTLSYCATSVLIKHAFDIKKRSVDVHEHSHASLKLYKDASA